MKFKLTITVRTLYNRPAQSVAQVQLHIWNEKPSFNHFLGKAEIKRRKYFEKRVGCLFKETDFFFYKNVSKEGRPSLSCDVRLL